MKLIVGLGNPGTQYEHTRHNIGFKVIDYVSKVLEIPLNQSKHKSLYGEGRYQNQKVLLIKPMTYMNLSGESVKEWLAFHKLTEEEFLVIFDDLDLSPGHIRLRMKGGAGGHNGVKSIIHHLGTQDFKRIKVGIGRPEHGDIVSYVLGRFNPEEQPILEETIQTSARASLSFLEEEDFTKTMNLFNG